MPDKKPNEPLERLDPNTKEKPKIEQLDPAKDRAYVASQWQLMWWKFIRHRLAVISAVVIVLLYGTAIFAEFIAPYNPQRRTGNPYSGPVVPQFRHEDGFQLRPFVYGLTSEMDMTTFRRVYVLDETEQYSLQFFVRGEPYKLFGFIPADLRLFGVEEGGAIYLMGTDQLGRDVFSRVIYGARISLSIGLVGVVLGLILGIFFGGISGYFGGITDMVVQRIIEILRSFPSIPLWMALAAALPADWSPILVYFGITVILSLIGWTGLARVVRGRFLSLRGEDFVLAARLSGASEARVIRKHMLPSFMSHIIASMTLAIPGMILAETSLSFLGIGLRPPVVSWGVLLQDAQNIHAVAMAPWLMYPGLAVVVAVLAFNFVGDGLRDAADPYSSAT